MNYGEIFSEIRELARDGGSGSVDQIMLILESSDIPISRAVDFYLGTINNELGLARIEHYLFNGSQIQRNYSTLFFSRRDEWEVVHRAYKLGLIDYIQAYAR